MTRKIPASIKKKVMEKWLEAKSRDLTARECEISSGSVSAIVQEFRRSDKLLDLLRIVTLQLKEHNFSVKPFAGLIRCWQLLKSEYSATGKIIEVKEEEIDAIVEAFSVFCFTKKMTVPEFGNAVLTCCYAAEELGVALCDLPAHITTLKNEAIEMQTKVDSLSAKWEQLFHDYEITRDQLQELFSYGPYLPKAYLNLKEENRRLNKELTVCKTKIKNEEIYRRAEEIKAERKALGGYLSSKLVSSVERTE